jgi:hypothetical protein
VIILWLAAAAEAACSGSVSPAEIQSKVDAALEAWAALDDAGFSTKAAEVESTLPCVSAPLSPGQAAALHRLRGLEHFAGGQDDLAGLAFAAARTVDPASRLSEAVAPSGGPLADLFEKAPTAAAAAQVPLDLPPVAAVWVDGKQGPVRPDAVPSVVQIGPAGTTKVVFTARMGPGGVSALPADLLTRLASPPKIADLDTDVLKSGGGGGGGKGWLIAAGASAVVSGGLFGAAIATRGAYVNEPSASSYNLNRATYWGSVGTIGLAGVFGGIGLAGSL